jgi:hypothetical protein
MSDWFIQKSGFSSDKVLGPLTSEQVVALFIRGEIKKKTPLASQRHTNNEWMVFGQTVLWKKAQETIELQKQKKEDVAAERKKQQEQEKLQLQQLREQEQAVVADRQQAVVADQQQPVPSKSFKEAIHVAEAIPTSNQDFPSGQSTYRKTVSQRFESSNSILDLFDWKFEKYVTPLIIRITWIIVVIGFLCVFVYFMVGPEVWASIGSGSSSSSSGTGFRIPHWMILIMVRVVQALMMVIMLLWIRVLLECMIVIFNIAGGVSNIENNTDSDQ